ncbi:MAG: DNA polymerase IV [Pelobium sp.]
MPESPKEQQRKIIHLDMDAFYASVEQRDFPELRGKPLAVGGSPDGRGVVATASYEARKFGVRSAMSSRKALELCPELLFTFPRFEVYKEVSQKLREIFSRYTDLIEPLSLDEAYLDVTADKQGIGSALEIAKRIKEAIQTELNLTASAGVSVNKFVAKIASDIHKPDGLTFIGPSKVISFIESLAVEKFFGVGKVTATKMKNLGIFTGLDLKQRSEKELKQLFGKSGLFFYRMVRGLDDRPVQAGRLIKSIGVEDTFENDLDDPEALKLELEKLAQKVAQRLKAKNRQGRTLTLKLKFSDFVQITRNHSFNSYEADQEVIYQTAVMLLEKIDLKGKKIRLLGITLSNFQLDDGVVDLQLRLFEG